MKLNEIKPNERNPRTITKDKLEKLKRSIKDFDKMMSLRPIVVDENNVILGGNMRYNALKALGYKEIKDEWVKRAEDLTEEEKKRFIIEDNVGFGEWDWDMLANEWEVSDLQEWGLDLPIILKDIDEVIEEASDGSIRDFEEDTNYDLGSFIRAEINEDLTKRIKDGFENGEIREELKNVFIKRAEQCTIFNFDQLIKYYRSGDATDTEKYLLERLYLVFLTPKEVFEKHIEEIDRVTGEIYDLNLIKK